jgi:transformation/transcription domain-associated protein
LRFVLRHLFVGQAGAPQLNSNRKAPTTPLDVFIASLPQSLVCRDSDDIRICKGTVLVLIQDITALSAEVSRFREAPGMLHRLASRFAALCYEPSWKRKTAGFTGLSIMTVDADLGYHWNLEREVEIVRALLFALKDMPQDVPRNAQEVHAILLQVIRVCNPASQPPDPQDQTPSRKWFLLLVNVLIGELASIHPAVRQAAKACIELLSSIYGRTPSEMLMPHKERLLVPIFAKPLRALPVACQIGNVDAMTYSLSLDPPLPEMSDELLRLLQEALAFAEAEDTSLVNRPAYRQAVASASSLRVACIKLLTAAMPITEMFAKQGGTRQSYVAPRKINHH